MPGKELVPRPAVPPPATIDVPPWQPQKRQSEAAYKTIGKWCYRNRHFTVPLAIPAVLWPAAVALHHFHATGFVLVLGLVVAGLVAYFAPHKWDRAGEQWYARVSAAAAFLWLWLATWLGPARSEITALALGALLIAGSIAWAVPWWRHKRPRGRRRREKKIAKWDAWWQSHCWGWNLGGSRVVDVWEMGVTTKLLIQGLPGKHSIQHVIQVMHLIESGADGHADIGMIRAEAVKGKPSQFFLFLKRENPLRQIVEYDLALAPRSVHDPAPVGLTETGTWKTASLRVNSFVIGATRTGKSNHLLVRIAALTGCPDDRQILIDLKGGRSARPVLKAAAAEYVVTEVDEARLLLRMLVAESLARNKYAYDGNEQLLASRELPALHLLIDEVHGLTSTANGDAECSRHLANVASQGNAVEIYTEVYTQHGSLEESVRTEQTRANLALRVVYRVEEARHGSYAIPEYSKLDASRLEEKGTCYIKDGPRALPEQVRAPHMPHKLLVRVATQNLATAGHRLPLRLYCGDEIAYGEVTWQQWWDARWGRLDPAFRDDSPQYQEWAAVRSAPSPAAAFRAAEEIRDAAVPADAVPSAPGEGDGRSAEERVNQELAESLRGIPADYRPPQNVNLTPVITRQKDAFAAALASAPPDGISPKQLATESNRGRTWVHQMLGALTEAGAVTQVGRGRYVPMPGVDVAEAMEMIQEDHDQLHREAKVKISAA
jgi:hypothetical protein